MESSGLRQVAQRAEDFDRAVGFYRDTLGLSFIAAYDPPGLAFFRLGEVRLLVERGAPGALLYIQVDDIDRAHDDLVGRGVEFVDDPHIVFVDTEGTFGPPGTEEWMSFFRDSEGNLLALVEARPTSG